MDKNYSIPEANEMLAHIAPALIELRNKYPKAIEVQKKIEDGALTNGGASKRDEWNRLLARVQELFDRFDEWQIVIRDLDEGLVDLPAEIDGGPAYMCWKLGEPSVTHWHRRDEGFAGRRPL
jgi:hypothetical protein